MVSISSKKKILEELEIRGRIETIQTTAFLTLVIILIWRIKIGVKYSRKKWNYYDSENVNHCIQTTVFIVIFTTIQTMYPALCWTQELTLNFEASSVCRWRGGERILCYSSIIGIEPITASWFQPSGTFQLNAYIRYTTCPPGQYVMNFGE